MVRKIKLLVIAVLVWGMITTAFATKDGFYMGAQGGYSYLHNTSLTLNGTKSSASNKGIGARLYVGYQGNEYYGAEMGYTYYSPTKYNGLSTSNCGSPTIKESAFDFVAKGIFPLFDTGFSAFLKAGGAIARQTESGTLASLNCSGGQNTLTTSFRPTAALGFSYDVTQSLVVDFTASRVFKGGGLPNADLVSLGFAYHIVNKQCGQFLC